MTRASRIVHVVVLLVGLCWLLPVLGLVLVSLRDDDDPPLWTLAPVRLTLDNYVAVFADSSLVSAIATTVVVSLSATVVVSVLSAMAAYALAWIPFRGRQAVLLVTGLLVLVPVQVALLPISRLYGRLGIYGDVPGLVLVHVAFGLPFGIVALRGYMLGIPEDLIDAARVDGATEWRVLRRLVAPMSAQAITGLAAFQFLLVWNDLLTALVFAGHDAAPLTVALNSQLRQFDSNIGVVTAASVASMAVPLVVFVTCRRFLLRAFVAGVSRGMGR
jgi:alpha-glucoside transport system permease protein